LEILCTCYMVRKVLLKGILSVTQKTSKKVYLLIVNGLVKQIFAAKKRALDTAKDTANTIGIFPVSSTTESQYVIKWNMAKGYVAVKEMELQ
jgi:hypothetical protein